MYCDNVYKISDSTVFVQGAKCGAIYNFNTHQVFSVNYKACEIIKKYIKGDKKIIDDEFLVKLRDYNLIDKDYLLQKYICDNKRHMKLEMVWLEVTQKCNLKCIHCYEGNDHGSGDEVLSLKEWEDIIYQLAELKVKQIIVIGGEPCCSKDICSILDFASKFSICVTLFTNATLIDDEIFNCVIRNNIKIKVSLYGPNAKVHDLVTSISGSFNKLVTNVKRLKTAGVDITASIVVMRENEKYLRETISFAKSLGLNYRKFDVIRNIYGGTQCEHTPITKNALEGAYFTEPNFWTSEEAFEKNLFQNSCWYGKMAIKENGDIIPCEFERNYVYGNIRGLSIKEVLHLERVVDKWFLTFDQIETCKDCEYRYACKDCRALGISVNNNMYSKNPRCLYDPYNGVWGKCINDE